MLTFKVNAQEVSVKKVDPFSIGTTATEGLPCLAWEVCVDFCGNAEVEVNSQDRINANWRKPWDVVTVAETKIVMSIETTGKSCFYVFSNLCYNDIIAEITKLEPCY